MSSDLLVTIGLALAGLAALLHVYIFWLESFAWTGTARGVFKTTREQAEATRELAFNQGFYNLFLAISIATGTILYVGDNRGAGAALVFAGAGSMVAAGLVLLLSSPDKASAAIKQLAFPLVGIILLALGLVH